MEKEGKEPTPYGAFYTVFRWDLTRFDYAEPSLASVRVRDALEVEVSDAARVWHEGLSKEEGSPWADYLKRWTVNSGARWFLDSRKRLSARILVAEKDGKIVGMNGLVPEKKSGTGRFFTGLVVAPEERRRGVGSFLLYRSLVTAKEESLHYAEVETIPNITASKFLYPKFGGIEKTAPR